MAEPNGSGRLDRIEALLEKLAERTTTSAWLHEQRLLQIEQYIEEMQEDEKSYRLAQRERSDASDARVDKLVASIADLIQRIPVERLKE